MMIQNSLDEDQEDVKIVGYDRYTSIADDTEKACKLHMKSGSSCTSPELVMLPTTSKACSGEIYMITEGTTVRIV